MATASDNMRRAHQPEVGPSIGVRLAALLIALSCPVAVSAADVVEYYGLDAIGNVRIITDENGNVIERHDYYPFGEECTTGPCASNPGAGAGQARKFTGKERDTETGFDYFGARYYGSKIGRFTTIDPFLNVQASLVNPQAWNRYSYVMNNPLRWTDPDGRCVDVATCVLEFGEIATTAGPYGRAIGIGVGVAVGVALVAPNVSMEHAGKMGSGEPLTMLDYHVQTGFYNKNSGDGSSEGIYEFPDAQTPGKTYVGQSKDVPRRLKQHEKSGKKSSDAGATTTEVSGSKTDREVAEQGRINQLGGTRDKPGSQTSNIRNPIGPARQAEMEKKKQ